MELSSIGAFAYPYTALATLVISLLIMVFAGKVGKMRDKHSVKAPSTTGNSEFECANRVHLNTIEAVVMFLPVMWLFALLVSDLYAAAFGALWIIGRIDYSRGYMDEPSKRSRGMMVGFIALVIPFFWTLYAVVMQLI